VVLSLSRRASRTRLRPGSVTRSLADVNS